MSHDSLFIGETGLRFFGKVSASISHEIKNRLAIINENAGLLEDLSAMAASGRELDPQRTGILAQKIGKQVSLADGIVKNLNRFAHSIDETTKTVELDDLLSFVIELYARTAARKSVTVEHQKNNVSVAVKTSPFFLQGILWLCLDFATDALKSGESFNLQCRESEKGAQVSFTGLGKIPEAMLEQFPGEREKALLGVLGAELTLEGSTGEMTLTVREYGIG
jgi:C4-dicarboxylate-specific signal transduction histidine kinase